MAVALGQNDQQLGEILAALTAPDTTRIKQAEDALKPVLKRPESVGLLTTQVSRSENPAVRQIAAVILRKKIGKLWKKLKKNSVSQMKAALAIQPVCVGVEADKNAFQMYKHGILNSKKCGHDIDHAVTAVG